MEILNQLGNLVLGSVPTAIFFILLVIAYNVLVGGPLEKVLAERAARTSGAVEQAREEISKAESETAAYEEKLRAARAAIVAAREAKLKQWAEERDAAISAARVVSLEKVSAARKDIEASAAAARKQIEEAASSLSEQVLAAVLPRGVKMPEARQ
jgi:F-type H+-transporting ATPase subunit b